MVEVYFEWQRSESGYRWIASETRSFTPAKPEKGRFLTDDWAAHLPAIRHRRLQPLDEHTGLCKTLAQTPPDPESIVTFANKYGTPLGSQAPMIILPHRATKSGHLSGRGEGRGLWFTAIEELRQAFDIWERVKEHDIDALSRHISWEGKAVAFRSHPEFTPGESVDPAFRFSIETIAGEHHRKEVFDRIASGDVIRPAELYIQRVISKHLLGNVSPQLLWNPGQTQMKLHLVPGNLLAAIWLQFARAVEHGSDFRSCAECDTWFEVSRGGGRSDKLYCSNTCRVNFHRKRISKAVAMKAKGKRLPEIAKHLETDEKTVGGWLERDRSSPSKPKRLPR